MRARTSTIGLKAGWVVTSATRSPSIHTWRPSRIDSRYSAPVLIMPCSVADAAYIGQIGISSSAIIGSDDDRSGRPVHAAPALLLRRRLRGRRHRRRRRPPASGPGDRVGRDRRPRAHARRAAARARAPPGGDAVAGRPRAARPGRATCWPRRPGSTSARPPCAATCRATCRSAAWSRSRPPSPRPCAAHSSGAGRGPA